MSLHVHVSICVFACVRVCPSVCLWLSSCLCACGCACACLCVSVCMSMCPCMSVSICMFLHVHVSPCVCLHVHMRPCVSTCVSMHVHVSIRVSVCLHLHVCACPCPCVSVCLRVSACVWVCGCAGGACVRPGQAVPCPWRRAQGPQQGGDGTWTRHETQEMTQRGAPTSRAGPCKCMQMRGQPAYALAAPARDRLASPPLLPPLPPHTCGSTAGMGGTGRNQVLTGTSIGL